MEQEGNGKSVGREKEEEEGRRRGGEVHIRGEKKGQIIQVGEGDGSGGGRRRGRIRCKGKGTVKGGRREMI